MNVKHVVIVPLDLDRAMGVARKAFARNAKNKSWVNYRMKLFTEYTLPSLLNQTFRDFTVWLMCSPARRRITAKWSMPENVKKVYDLGKKELIELNADFLAVTRIDSDDLFHKGAMAEVRRNVMDREVAVVWKRVYVWNILHRFITERSISNSPFITSLFMKKAYKNHNKFINKMFRNLDKLNRVDTVLSPRMVCTIRHAQNIHWKRLRRVNPHDGRRYRKKRHPEYKNMLERDPEKMFRILRDFGVREDMV